MMFERYVPLLHCLRPLPVHTNPDIFETVYFLTRIRVDVAYEAYRKIPKISPSMYKPLQI